MLREKICPYSYCILKIDLSGGSTSSVIRNHDEDQYFFRRNQIHLCLMIIDCGIDTDLGR